MDRKEFKRLSRFLEALLLGFFLLGIVLGSRPVVVITPSLGFVIEVARRYLWSESVVKTESEERQRMGMIEVAVVQNGPFKTSPYGSDWYKRGATINLVATPEQNHQFKRWETNTALIEIRNPIASSTTATLKGSGVITAVFV